MHLIVSTLVLAPSNPLILRFWLAMARNGVYGVFLFFVVSGFLITRLLDQMPGGLFSASPRRFYVRRAGRILPLFLVSILLGLAIRSLPTLTAKGWIVGFALPNPSDLLFWLSVFTFTFNWFAVLGEGVFFGTGFHWDLLWSLAVEEQFYLFYPWVLRGVGNARRLCVFLLAICLLGPSVRAFAAYFYPRRHLLAYMATPSILDCIAWGALLYLSWGKWEGFLRGKPGLSRVLVLGGLGVVGAVYFGSSIENPWELVWAPTGLAMGLSIFFLGGLALPFFQSPLIRILALPGKLSYGIYLLHMIVLYALSPWLQGKGITFSLGLFLSFVFLIAWLSNRYFEKPLNLWIRRLEAPKGNLFRVTNPR
jgi:peptidoglycan/LPS O-acetylase OafA/YrhL